VIFSFWLLFGKERRKKKNNIFAIHIIGKKNGEAKKGDDMCSGGLGSWEG
jgi:hypothetical protein